LQVNGQPERRVRAIREAGESANLRLP
jgi:hypothetical protein